MPLNNLLLKRKSTLHSTNTSSSKKSLNTALSSCNSASSTQSQSKTPATRTAMTSRFAKVVESSAEKSSFYPFDLNPVCKGRDYSEIMLKKTEFGYSGPGYSKTNFFLEFSIHFSL
jgi:hypothetical protein